MTLRGDAVGNGTVYGSIYTPDGSKVALNAVNGMVLSVGALTPAVTVLPNGNVGIGTLTPQAKLHVVKDTSDVMYIHLNKVVAASDTWLLFRGGVSVGGSSMGSIYSSTGTNLAINGIDGVTLSVGNLTPVVTVLTNGNVGIGLINPSEKLQVTGSVRIGGGSLYVITSSKIFDFQGTTVAGNYGAWKSNAGVDIAYIGDGNGSAISGYTVNDFAISTPAGKLIFSASTNLILQPVAGNVGIGTTNPLQKLHIVTSTGGNYGLRVEGAAGAGPGIQFYDAAVTQNKWIIALGVISGTDGKFGIFDERLGLHRMIIDADGHLYVGGTTAILIGGANYKTISVKGPVGGGMSIGTLAGAILGYCYADANALYLQGINQIIFSPSGAQRFAIGANGDWILNSSVGTAGQVLRSSGPGAPPYWSN
jgi:hypothetical protein